MEFFQSNDSSEWSLEDDRGRITVHTTGKTILTAHVTLYLPHVLVQVQLYVSKVLVHVHVNPQVLYDFIRVQLNII